MAKIASKLVQFTPTDSPDAVEYRGRFVHEDGTFDYEDAYFPIPLDLTTLPNGDLEYLIPTTILSELVENEIYGLYVTTADRHDNESDPGVAPDLVFDTTPPNPPRNVRVVSSSGA
jgi:hypothetical protein